MTVKTVEFSGNAVTDFTTLEDALNRAPGKGYCELWTWDLTKTSNTEICGADAATTNIGFYARVTFPTCFNSTKYLFNLPIFSSTGPAGIAKIDGVAQESMDTSGGNLKF